MASRLGSQFFSTALASRTSTHRCFSMNILHCGDRFFPPHCCSASCVSTLQSFLYCAANLPGNVVVFVLIDRIGRRSLLLWSMLAAVASALAFAFVAEGGSGGDERTDDDEQKPNALLVVTMAMLFNAACTAAWDAINVVSTESFPTAVNPHFKLPFFLS